MKPTDRSPITCEEAASIANAEAETVYRELHLFRIEIVHASDGWHVDYELKDPNQNGGGPHYVIDAITGDVVSKTYNQ